MKNEVLNQRAPAATISERRLTRQRREAGQLLLQLDTAIRGEECSIVHECAHTTSEWHEAKGASMGLRVNKREERRKSTAIIVALDANAYHSVTQMRRTVANLKESQTMSTINR